MLLPRENIMSENYDQLGNFSSDELLHPSEDGWPHEVQRVLSSLGLEVWFRSLSHTKSFPVLIINSFLICRVRNNRSIIIT